MCAFIKEFPGISLILFLFILGFAHSIIIALLKKEPSPIGKITKTILSDVFSLLSFMIVGAIIVVILSNKDVPPILSYGATGVFSANFGRLTAKKRTQTNGESEEEETAQIKDKSEGI